jgi:hypothetical protein
MYAQEARPSVKAEGAGGGLYATNIEYAQFVWFSSLNR